MTDSIESSSMAHLKDVVNTYDSGKMRTGQITIFIALPHALAYGNDGPNSTRLGPRLYCWKRQPQKKAVQCNAGLQLWLCTSRAERRLAPPKHDSLGLAAYHTCSNATPGNFASC